MEWERKVKCKSKVCRQHGGTEFVVNRENLAGILALFTYEMVPPQKAFYATCPACKNAVGVPRHQIPKEVRKNVDLTVVK